jgi:hypothetical protein
MINSCKFHFYIQRKLPNLHPVETESFLMGIHSYLVSFISRISFTKISNIVTKIYVQLTPDSDLFRLRLKTVSIVVQSHFYVFYLSFSLQVVSSFTVHYGCLKMTSYMLCQSHLPPLF